MFSICNSSRACFLIAMLLFSCLLSVAFAQDDVLDPNRKRIATLIEDGEAAYDEGRFEEGLRKFWEAASTGSPSENVAYNAACCAALIGETDAAFQFLGLAIDRGWINIKHLRNDSDLEVLHADPRWDGLVDELESSIRQSNLLWRNNAFRSKFQENLSDAEKAAGLANLWSEVKFNFVNFHQVPDLDWDAEFKTYMPRVLASRSTQEYYRLLQEMVAKLKDAHTNVYLPRRLGAKLNATPKIKTALIEDRVVVSSVSTSTVKVSSIAIGDELVSVNGVPVRKYAAENVQPFVCASTKQDLENRVFGNHLLRGPKNEPVLLELKNRQGTEYNVELQRTGFLGQMSSFLTRPPAFEMEVREGNIAYVKLNSFSSNVALQSFESAIGSIQKTDGLIIDLRKNGGGNSGVGWSILGYLTKEKFPANQWYMLQYRPTFRAKDWMPQTRVRFKGSVLEPNGDHFYDKPVVLLVGVGTFSAAEDMAVVFDMMDRGKIIGQATGGSTGQPIMIDLPGGGRARICTKHDAYQDGTEFVGVGVLPDIVVKETVEDLCSGVDRTFKCALEFLSTEATK